MDEMVISLTTKGLTTGEVQAHLAEVDGDGVELHVGWTEFGVEVVAVNPTANGFAADAASLKELMARMGHSTARALIYQHARRDREAEIAAAVSARVENALRKRSK